MDANSRCPRCQAEFACAAQAGLEEACACFGVGLSDEARRLLRERHATCVCVACLRAVQAETLPTAAADVDITPPWPRSEGP